MLHRSKPDPILSKDDATAVESAPRSVLMTDRSAPGWAAIFGALFSFGGSLCLIGVGLLASFFQSVVAQGGEVRMIAVLVGLGLVLLTGFLVLEVAHTRALAGYRFLREENTRRFRAYAALPAFFLLTFVHPIAGLAIPFGLAIGLGMQWLLFRWARLMPIGNLSQAKPSLFCRAATAPARTWRRAPPATRRCLTAWF